MAERSATRSRLLRPAACLVVWHGCTLLGLGLAVLAVTQLSAADWRAMGAPIVVILLLVAASQLRPVVGRRPWHDPAAVSQAFVFAVLYLWGLYPALIVQLAAVPFSQILARKPLWRALYSAAQHCISTAAAWMVLREGFGTASAQSPTEDFAAEQLGWVLGSWVAYHVVNLVLSALIDLTSGQAGWSTVTGRLGSSAVSTFAVLALSPMVAVTAVASDESWILMPLLMLPLVALQRTEQMSWDREYQALHDPLTGLPNRVLLTDRLELGLAREPRSPGTLAVMFLDLDQFQIVNDGLGHAAGDELLVDVAERLASVVRVGDTLARFGGDEFAVVCESVPVEEVADLAERVRGSLQQAFSYAGREVTISASVGVVVASEGCTAQTMLRDADAALNRAKSAGRDQVVHFHTTMHEQAASRLDEQAALRRAIGRHELRVHFQPVIDLKAGTTVGMEALARWKHPERGLLGPDQFIPVAEETGLIVPLGAWVIDHAVAQLARWQQSAAEASDLFVAVNLSARQLRDPQLVDKVAQALHRNGVPARCLHLEITETVVMDSLEATIDMLERLRALGVRLVVDDFGTGYSSLAYLKRLPVDTVKIDRGFVDGLGREASDMSIIDAICNLARALNLGVIAEGVETIEQVGILRTLGAQAAQGYLWSRPLPADELQPWLVTTPRGALKQIEQAYR